MSGWIRMAEREGWSVRRAARGGHLKWYRPNGTFAFSCGYAPGNGRALDAVRANARRAGLKIT